MRRADRSGYVSVSAVVALVAAAGGGLLLPLSGAGPDPVPHAPPLVGAEVLEGAVTSEIPAHRTMWDEIAFYEHRISERGEDIFSLERLFQAQMLAFRAYGDTDHLDAAADAVSAMRALRPDSEAVARSASSLDLARHDFPAALAAARGLADGVIDDGAAWRLFDALWAAGEQDEARAILRMPVDTTSIGYLSRHARILDADGQVELARDRFLQVVELVRAFAEPAPTKAWALVELGHFELHSGHPEAAVVRYREALDVLPGSPAALEGLAAVAYGVDRDAAAARLLLERAIENGAHLDVLPFLADLQEESGDAGTAGETRADFIARATATEAGIKSYRRPLAFLLADGEGTQASAVALARDDLAQRRDPGAFDALAWALYRNGDVGMAWILAERAVSLGAPTPPVAYRAGVIAEAAGADDEARLLLTEAIDGAVELTTTEVAIAEETRRRAVSRRPHSAPPRV